MANPINMYSERTNQKLYFVQTALNRAENEKSVQLRQFYVETALQHLEGAVITLLQELAWPYKINLIDPTLNALKNALAQKEIVAPEVLQVSQYFEAGFIKELLQSVDVFHLNHHIQQRESHKSDKLVNLIQLNEIVLPSLQDVEQWLKSFKQMLSEAREQLVEF